MKKKIIIIFLFFLFSDTLVSLLLRLENDTETFATFDSVSEVLTKHLLCIEMLCH